MGIVIENKEEYNTSVSFVANMPRLVIKCDASEPDYKFAPHTGPCVQRGISFMYRQGGGCWHPLESGLPRKTFNVNMLAFTEEGSEYEILLYYSLFCKINSLSIEPCDGRYLHALERKKENIFVVGGSLSLGTGCATPGVAWSALLGRKTGREVYSLRSRNGFSGRELIERIRENADVARLADCIIIEADAAGDSSLFAEALTGLIAFKRPVIVLIDTPMREEKRDEIASVVKDSGIAQILDMSFLYDEDTADFYTLNSGIPTDAAHLRIYRELRKLMENKAWNI